MFENVPLFISIPFFLVAVYSLYAIVKRFKFFPRVVKVLIVAQAVIHIFVSSIMAGLFNGFDVELPAPFHYIATVEKFVVFAGNAFFIMPFFTNEVHTLPFNAVYISEEPYFKLTVKTKEVEYESDGKIMKAKFEWNSKDNSESRLLWKTSGNWENVKFEVYQYGKKRSKIILQNGLMTYDEKKELIMLFESNEDVGLWAKAQRSRQ